MSQGKIKEKGRKLSLSVLRLLVMNNKLRGKYALDALLRYDTSSRNLMYLLRYLTSASGFCKIILRCVLYYRAKKGKAVPVRGR
jgi:hypothetical protein